MSRWLLLFIFIEKQVSADSAIKCCLNSFTSGITSVTFPLIFLRSAPLRFIQLNIYSAVHEMGRIIRRCCKAAINRNAAVTFDGVFMLVLQSCQIFICLCTFPYQQPAAYLHTIVTRRRYARVLS